MENLELEVFEVRNFDRKNHFLSSLVDNRENFMGLNESCGYKELNGNLFMYIVPTSPYDSLNDKNRHFF